MLDPSILSIIVSVAALCIGGYALFRASQAGTPITGALLTTTAVKATATATEIVEIVKAGVFAAEQLKTTGKLPDSNAAFDYALLFAHKMLPDLSRETLTTFIESAVLITNQITDALPDASPEAKEF